MKEWLLRKSGPWARNPGDSVELLMASKKGHGASQSERYSNPKMETTNPGTEHSMIAQFYVQRMDIIYYECYYMLLYHVVVFFDIVHYDYY